MSSTILLLDIGNSRVKWALSQAGEWLAEGVSPHDQISKLLHDWDRFPSPTMVIGCNVAGEERKRLISQYWQGRKVPENWIKSTKTSNGITNLYDNPGQLGADRWAALVGAWNRAKSACLVVSAGTALTVDTLNQKGEFIGGFILPGKRLMYESLAAETHALDAIQGQISEHPRNTADAMTSGIAIALASAVQTGFQRLDTTAPTRPVCIVTGGDAEWLANQLPISVIIAPKLVMEGLLLMTEEFEQA